MYIGSVGINIENFGRNQCQLFLFIQCQKSLTFLHVALKKGQHVIPAERTPDIE